MKGGNSQSYAINLEEIQSIKDRLSTFRKDEITRIQDIRKLLKSTSYPSITNLRNSIIRGNIINLPFSIKDIDNYLYVYKHEISELRGKMKWQRSNNYQETPVQLDLLFEIKKRPLSIYGDIIFLGSYPFLLSVTKPIDLLQIVDLSSSRDRVTVLDGMDSQCRTLLDKYYIIYRYFIDREKAADLGIGIAMKLPCGILIDRSDPGTHQGQIERFNQTYKSRFRCLLSSIPFKLKLQLFRRRAANWVCRNINEIPNSNKILGITPRELMTGMRTDYSQISRVFFGMFAMIYNNKSSRTVHIVRSFRAICVGIDDNIKRSPIWFNLDTRRECICSNFTPLPIGEDIIELVNSLSHEPPLEMDDYDDSSYIEDDEREQDDIIAEIDDNMPNSQELEVQSERSDIDDTSSSEDSYVSALEEERQFMQDQVRGEIEDDIRIEDVPLDEIAELEEQADVQLGTVLEEEVEAEVIQPPADQYRREYRDENPPTEHQYQTRSRRSNYISSEFAACSNHTRANMAQCGYQISYERGLKTRPEATELSADIEIEKLVKLDLGSGVHENELTAAQARSIMNTFMFMKDKFEANGTFKEYKARLVGDGRNQDRNYLKEVYGSTSSPTALPGSVMIVIGLVSKRKMTTETADVGSAFIRNNLDDETFIRLSPAMASKWIRYKPQDAEYINRRGELVLKLNKSLYGCVQSPVLWYRNVNQFLKSKGFKRSRKDHCVYSKWDNGELTVIVTYVDDFMIASDSPERCSYYGDMVESHYQQVTRHRGVSLDYIGMNITTSHDEGLVELSMSGFVDEILALMPKTRSATSPAGEHLFHISGGPLLSPQKSKLFYSLVYMLLYLGKRVRPDILLAVQFLTCRVTKSTDEDYEKLQRVINYLHCTKDLKLRFRCGESVDLICYVDASHAVHDDYKSHTGVIITINGRCMVYCRSTKQSTNGVSSTESELIAVSDALPQIIYTKEFIEEILNCNVPAHLMQDNTSTIRLIEAGKALSERTRHINIRFFYVHQYVSDGILKIQYCPTKSMRADGFTKPLQGKEFIEFRDYILGYSED